MEPPQGFLLHLWTFICFLPYFIGLLLVGVLKGAIVAPIVCVIMTVGNSAIVLGLWPPHAVWTYFCILSAKRLGPVMKLVMCILVVLPLVLWPVCVVVGSIIGGLAYGFLGPVFGTVKAVGEGKNDKFRHCVTDGIWDTIKWSMTFVRDLMDVCLYSYFSMTDDLRKQDPPGGRIEIRVVYVPVAIIVGLLGFAIDFPVITVIAALKSPVMLLKGWHRLFHDCIGREGPFLETICVPFAGLAILLWPFAVAGALLGSMLAGIILGFYAAVVAYQESSFYFGICYILAALSIYDEYSNDILDMPEGSCFLRPKYRSNAGRQSGSTTPSVSRPASFKNPPSPSSSFTAPMVELKPLVLLDSLFQECRRQGEFMVLEGLITVKEIDDAKSGKASGRVISIGLPAYCLFQTLLRSANANSAGILLEDNVTEINTTNRPKDGFYDWFLNPLLVIKDQIKALNLTESEAEYLGKLVLLSGDAEKLKNSNIGPPPESEIRRAELDALTRRLQGITKSISRYPTYRRRFESSIKAILEELDRRETNGRQSLSGSENTRLFSNQRSFKTKTSNQEDDQEAERDVDIV
ncbi:putative membrane protein At3g27390 [Bidens hawaiensis]|uniref:putative membrane protein At3g27390 n=1 Tax=Bidens hawaiensis TaxID=980011 RepID=UPI00404B384A